MAEEQPTSPHVATPLESEWVFWVHKKLGLGMSNNYGSSMEVLGKFNTVEEFWQYMHNVPPPSEIFACDQQQPKKYGDREIDALSIFRKDIRPEWEDLKNTFGSEFLFKKAMGGGQLDQYWEEIAMGAVGEMLDSMGSITGVRVVDKTSKGKAAFRIEVWCEHNAENSPKLMEEIKANITEVLNVAGQKLDYKSHSSALSGDPHQQGSKRKA